MPLTSAPEPSGDADASSASGVECGPVRVPTLIVIRGNSGAGKSTVARTLRTRHGRGCALVEQDYLRRIVLRERDLPGGLAPALIEQTVRFALEHGYHTILEGILHRDRYADMITTLRHTHPGPSFVFYLDVGLTESLRRHAARPQATEFTSEHMRDWYAPRDLLGHDDEHLVPETSTLEQTVAFIATTAGLPLTGRTADFWPQRPVPLPVPRAQRSDR